MRLRTYRVLRTLSIFLIAIVMYRLYSKLKETKTEPKGKDIFLEDRLLINGKDRGLPRKTDTRKFDSIGNNGRYHGNKLKHTRYVIKPSYSSSKQRHSDFISGDRKSRQQSTNKRDAKIRNERIINSMNQVYESLRIRSRDSPRVDSPQLILDDFLRKDFENRVIDDGNDIDIEEDMHDNFLDIIVPHRSSYIKDILLEIENDGGQNRSNKVTTRKDVQMKLLMMLTPAFETRYWWDTPADYQMTDLDGSPCPETRCVVTYDRARFQQSDAVFFHGRDVRDIKPHEIHALRGHAPVSQFWVWAFMESPLNLYYDTQMYDGLFDWTATYKLASNFWTPYYRIKPLEPLERSMPAKRDYAAQKSKLIFGISSDFCEGYRTALVLRIKELTEFDFYGKCGRKFSESVKLPECKRGTKECHSLFASYKFVFAVENSFCDEYVTEKYYRNGLLSNTVPIVAVPPKFIHKKRYFITHSYINIFDFPSIERFVAYIQYLNSNDTAYNEYFSWKDKFKVVVANHRACLVCKRLWDIEEGKIERPRNTKKVNLTSFWSTDDCNRVNRYRDLPYYFAKYVR